MYGVTWSCTDNAADDATIVRGGADTVDHV